VILISVSVGEYGNEVELSNNIFTPLIPGIVYTGIAILPLITSLPTEIFVEIKLHFTIASLIKSSPFAG